MDDITRSAIAQHLVKQWPNHQSKIERWTKGPVAQAMPDLRVIVLSPIGTGGPWVYVTSGANEVDVGATYGIEFFLLSRNYEPQHVELLSLVTYMHRDPRHHLDVGHTMNLGRPWENNSNCDRLLVSLPFCAGPSFEILHLPNGGHVRFLWIIPITPLEESFRHREGLEALESRLEKARVDVTNPKRPSIIEGELSAAAPTRTAN